MQQRELAYQILKSCLLNGAYAQLEMQKHLRLLPSLKRPLVTELVNGVLRHYLELTAQFIKLAQKTNEHLKILLAMALYERFFMQQKDYVILSEYPKLLNKKGEKAFVTALLKKLDTYQEYLGDDDESLSIHYSMPLWIVKLIRRQYGDEILLKVLKESTSIPKLFYRLNFKRYDKNELAGITFLNAETFVFEHNLLNTQAFERGMFYVQDINSAKLWHYLDLNQGQSLLDMCAAPGGKLFNCLDIINPQDAYANDIHAHRVDLMRKQAHKLGFAGINFLNYDAAQLHKHLSIKFDRILLDAPCSGLGVMKRKPDLRYHIRPEDLDDLLPLQKALLEEGQRLLKSGGILVYSTCTLNRKENDGQIKNFLKNHEDFKLMEEKCLLFEEGGDAFYVAKLLKA